MALTDDNAALSPGLVVDWVGFPLEIGCFEGKRAEITTIVPVIVGQRCGIADMVIVADAGMPSKANRRT